MPCTLITGTPGAGKTLYCVDKLLPDYIGSKVKVTDKAGNESELERTVYTNINGLRLDHELIDADPNTGRWDYDIQAQAWKFTGNDLHLRNWQAWAKPGSVLIVDEFQFVWPPRPNGSRVPPDVQAFDTHRHGGVEFVLISQDAVNVDRHLTGRVDRHLHVRKVAGFGMSIVYEWDATSRQLLYRNAITKFPYRYGKKAYRNYVSASTHIKTKRKVPGLVWFILVGFLGLGILAPTFYKRFTDKAFGGVQLSATNGKTATASISPVQQRGAVPPPAAAASAPVFAGCVVKAGECRCFDSAGDVVQARPAYCESGTKHAANFDLRHLGSYVHPALPEPDNSMNFSPGIVNLRFEAKFQ